MVLRRSSLMEEYDPQNGNNWKESDKFVQEVYHSMLGHIRSRTLDRIKEEFDKALKGGKGFAVAARGCNMSFMSHFDEKCAVQALLKVKFLAEGEVVAVCIFSSG